MDVKNMIIEALQIIGKPASPQQIAYKIRNTTGRKYNIVFPQVKEYLTEYIDEDFVEVHKDNKYFYSPKTIAETSCKLTSEKTGRKKKKKKKMTLKDYICAVEAFDNRNDSSNTEFTESSELGVIENARDAEKVKKCAPDITDFDSVKAETAGASLNSTEMIQIARDVYLGAEQVKKSAPDITDVDSVKAETAGASLNSTEIMRDASNAATELCLRDDEDCAICNEKSDAPDDKN
ncbi:uncharacterized protein LOC119689999 [Teleopsis dalmanni]|uniref:uncharacterized protein LOC119689999 n=1 Tax=Teleopsis dalmanni TaxID=139649 RepID=UPI0018CDEAA4|nr:uncharacterized protein LOC119689999 [Teleopsis dalmanni]